jgi:cytidine deaminase
MVSITEDEKKLLQMATGAMKNAYVLWGFKVGAAVLAEDGKIYVGCNVESWVSGLGICAERCAINHAVLHGNRKIKKLALIVESKCNNNPAPCGACLQYINDFSENSKIKILVAKEKCGKVSFPTVNVKTLEDLLPYPFRK